MDYSAAPITVAGTALADGLHVSALFDDDADEDAVILPFIAEGIAAGERIALIVDPAMRDANRRALERGGTDVGRLEASRQLLIIDWNDAYIRSGRFDHELVLDLLRAAVAEAAALGYSRARVVGHMGWIVDSPPGVDALVEYEALATDLVAEMRFPAICVYRTDRFDPRTLVDVVRTHPTVVVGRTLHQNPYYPFLVPTGELLAVLTAWRGGGTPGVPPSHGLEPD